MADIDVVKISSLPLATSISDSDTLLAIQNEHAKRVPPSLMKGKKGDPGNTPILKKGNVSTGSTADVSIQKNDTDSNGNPIYILNIVLPKGDKGDAGKIPVLGTVTTTTGEAGSSATAKFSLNGIDTDGNPKYDLALTIPQGTKGNIGFTPILQIGTVTGGDTANAGIVQNGTDTNGNPIYKINLTLPKGSAGNTGKTPQISIGTVTTGNAGTSASAALATNGTDTNGNPKYLLSLTIPRGDAGSLGTGDAKDLTVTFAESTTREEIASGSTIATIFGKIKKWFTDLKSVAFSGSYTDLSDKPTIPTKTSQLTNDSSFPTKTDVTNAVSTHNSATDAHSTQFAGKQDKLTAGTGIDIAGNVISTTLDLSLYQLVTSLPTSNISTNKIYLVQSSTSGTNNIYTEYIYVNSAWEILGEYKSSVDLTPYYTKTQEDALLANKVNTVSGKGLSTNDFDTTYKGKLDFITGSNSVTTLASLPVTKNLVIATLSAATTISLAAALAVNQSIHICATATTAFTQPIPNSGDFVSMSGSSVSIASGARFEIDILCTAESKYQIMVSIQS